MRKAYDALQQPRDSAGLAVFRMMFGALTCLGALRFVQNGWVERFFGERTFFFKYWGFSWLTPGPVWAMYGVYVALAALGLCVALGLFYRVAIVLFFVLFSYAELTDVTNYLNHYYLVSLLALLMSFMPLHGKWSLDARRSPALRRDFLPAWMPYLLRFQIATVYTGAALAKVGRDWLAYGEPLHGWLSSLVDQPWIGPYLTLPSVALFASWGGFLHDLLVVPLLLWRRSRPLAFAGLVVFHGLTSTWFNIGIFPVLMPMAATLFFDPAWPKRLLARLRGGERLVAVTSPSSTGRSPPLARLQLAALTLYCALQALMPFRTHLYGGNVLWHEQGMRFSWRVMLRAKAGSIVYRVELPDGRELRIPPRRYLTGEQEREMSGQPDLILQLAHHITRDLEERRGVRPVAVRVDALVSLNGRSPAPMIDPSVDLSRVEDGLGLATWITAPPREPPSPHMPLRPYASVVP